MYQPLIKFHPHPAIITQVLCIFEVNLEDFLHTVKIEVQQNCFLAHDFERSEKE